LVRFGPRRNITQIYLVHGDGGNVLGFRELALRLRDRADLVGVQAIGVEPNCEPDPDLSTMVTRYLDAIRADRAAAADDSVLLLGGYSGGGKVAVAMAAQWGSADVGPIALLDAPVSEYLAPSKLGRTGSVIVSAFRRGPQTLTHWAQMSARAWNVRFEARAKKIEPRFAYVESIVSAATSNPPTPARLPNGAFVIRVMERNPVFSVDFGWGSVLKTDVPEHWIPGHHLTMFVPPNVDALHEALLAGFGHHLPPS
jgi:thioesterase domain-containing protein